MPYNPIKPLEFGIAIHKGMEIFFDPETYYTLGMEKKLAMALKAFDDENDEQRRKYITQPFARDDLDDYEERKQLGAGMLTYYAREIHPKLDGWFKPVRTEVSFHVPLRDPETGEDLRCFATPGCGQEHEMGAKVTLDGRLDVLIEDLVNGGYFILDWKTAGTLLQSSKHLYLDDQIGSYTAALVEELEIDVKGFLYVELAKMFPQSPKQNKRKTKGCMYSQSKSQPTTYEIAELTYRLYDKDAYEAGLYDEYLQWLKNTGFKFHQRFAIRQSEKKAKNILANTAMEAAEMTRVDLRIYPEPSKFNCPNCPFYEPCVEKLSGEDYEFTLQEGYEINNG